MKNMLLAGAASCFLYAHVSSAEVLNFDSITTGNYAPLHFQNHGGLQWTYWSVIDPPRYYNEVYSYPLSAPYAFGAGVSSGSYLAFSNGSGVATISATRYFRINNGFFAGGVNPTATVVVTGYANSQPVFSQTYTFSRTVGAVVNLNTPWLNQVVFGQDDWFSVDDLSINFAPDAEITTEYLRQNAAGLRRVMDNRLSSLASMVNYDCHTFDKYGVCISFQARYASFDSSHEGAGVLTAAYRVTPEVRVGAFIDYRVTEKELDGIRPTNELPTFGAFLGYSQNSTGQGLQGKLLAAFHTSDVTITRDSLTSFSEPGSGTANLRSSILSGEIGWGFALAPSMVATPYVAVRFTDSTRGHYSEGTIDGVVDLPISYDSYSQRLTTATAGIRFNGMLTDKIGYHFGFGLDHDLRQRTSAYSGSSSIPDLETFSLETDGVKNRTRGFGSVGMFYQVEKNQRLTGNVTIRDQAYSSQTVVNVMGGYQIAF